MPAATIRIGFIVLPYATAPGHAAESRLRFQAASIRSAGPEGLRRGVRGGPGRAGQVSGPACLGSGEFSARRLRGAPTPKLEKNR